MNYKDLLLEICAGEEKEAEKAFTCLYENSWEEVFGVLKSKTQLVGLEREDLREVTLDGFREFWDMARSEKINDFEKDPRALLHTICFRRGIDLLRFQTAGKRQFSPGEWDALIKESLDGTTIYNEWRKLERERIASEVIREFLVWMQSQEGVCRRTAFAMAQYFPDLAGPKQIYDDLCDTQEFPPTYDSVKKARADVLAKFRTTIKKNQTKAKL